MPYESTSKKNQRQLTIDQHFHSAHAISKFYDFDNKVEVKFLASGNVEKRHKRAKIFSTKRTWDQRAETGYMVQIEQAFHDEIDNIKDITARNHEAISRYWLLWQLRHILSSSKLSRTMVICHFSKGVTKVICHPLDQLNLPL